MLLLVFLQVWSDLALGPTKTLQATLKSMQGHSSVCLRAMASHGSTSSMKKDWTLESFKELQPSLNLAGI